MHHTLPSIRRWPRPPPHPMSGRNLLMTCLQTGWPVRAQRPPLHTPTKGSHLVASLSV